MKYNPKDANNCWPKGEYPAVIEKVTESTSKNSGNEMEVVSFRVFSDGGKEMVLLDYIVNPTTLFKLKGIAKALNKKADFDLGTFQVSDQLQSNLILVLDIEEDDEYGDKNRIKGYKPSLTGGSPVPASAPKPQKPAKAASPIGAPSMTEEDIPF